MRFLSTAIALLSIIIATSSQTVLVDDGKLCPASDFFLAAFRLTLHIQDKACDCQTDAFVRQEGGTACANVAPPNSFPTYWGQIVPVWCKYSLSPHPQKCIVPSINVVQDSRPTDAGDAPATALAQPLTQPHPVFIELYRAPVPPPTHGKEACKNVGSGSKCTVDCEPGYKASDDEKSCGAARNNVTMSEIGCSSDAGAVQYLSADPNGGCMCKTKQDSTFCGVAFGDPDAEMMCSDTTDLQGNREVKCAVRCSDEFIPKDKNTCEPREVEGDTVTMAGTASPNSGEAACASKVFKLSGKGGCKCDTSAPQGGTECVAGRNAYPVCMYEQGSGEEAACGIACVPGKNLFGNSCR
ncbi:hypothetical protein B0H11DRAFT_2186428 [Mycena galericulata]|nr:hypothetical protein B0H11DRAFT_2186428 [Mycena galericulata]